MTRRRAIALDWLPPSSRRAVLLLVTLLSAACASTASKASAASKSSTSPLSSAEFALLVGYGATARDQPIRDHAEQTLDRRCMRKHGFKYILDPSTWRANPEDRNYVPGIGTTRTERSAVALRRLTGYHLYSAKAAQVPANDQYVRSLSPADQARYMLAEFGPQSKYQTIHQPGGGTLSFPTAGCVARAQIRLYGSAKAAQELLVFPGDFLAQLGKQTTSDGTVVTKGKPWSRCTSAAIGIHIASVTDIVDRLKREYAANGMNATTHRREIAWAVADTRCQFRTGLAAAYAQAFHQQADQLRAPTRRLLQRLLGVEQLATRRARHVVAGRG